jgi:hypothetical protein
MVDTKAQNIAVEGRRIPIEKIYRIHRTTTVNCDGELDDESYSIETEDCESLEISHGQFKRLLHEFGGPDLVRIIQPYSL